MRDDLEQLCAAQAEAYGQGPLEMRLEIQGLVKFGQITPQDAEDWLREWPHKTPEDPFAVEPDPAKFDPLREAYWTLGMSTAWVLWRALDAVREEWDEFVSERTRWVKINERDARATAPDGYVEAKGFELRAGSPRGAWGVLNFARVFPVGLTLSAAECEHELVGALQRGDLIAIHGRDQHVAEIPALKWAGLSPFTPGREALHDAVYARGEHRPAYLDVKVRRDAVMRHWPSKVSGASASCNLQASASRQTRQKALADIAIMRAAAVDPPMPEGLSRDEFKEELEERLGRTVNRDVARKLHADPEVYPVRPGMGPRLSGRSVGK